MSDASDWESRVYPTQAHGADVPDAASMKVLRRGEAISLTLHEADGVTTLLRKPDGVPDGYDKLREVLRRAVEQAAVGKGKERHAHGEPFHEQKIVKLTEWTGGTGFAVGQACKKALESTRLPRDRAVAELLGAINYLAAAVIVLEEQPPT